MKTAKRIKCGDDVLGRDGETHEEMLGWFTRRGLEPAKWGADKLTADELERLAGQITHLLLHYNDK